jgi:hypothetical protein
LAPPLNFPLSKSIPIPSQFFPLRIGFGDG